MRNHVHPLIGFAAAASLAWAIGHPSVAAAAETVARPVTVVEEADSFTLANGILTARIMKASGDIRSLKYRGIEVFTDRSGHAGGYWSHDTSGGKSLETRVTIDPADNSGRRGEVSVKGISGGIKMGHGPGTAADGDFPADIEIRYALGRGESGVYTYSLFNHLPEHGAATMSEARFAVKLADYFDWMSIDEQRNKHYPKPDTIEDKYVYTALQSANRAYGFSSTTRNLGFYLINPTIEYLSGGPTKPEFLCHRDTTATAAPVVLNYWRSSHYGGANVSVEAGESWTKVIGPFLLYVNEGDDPNAMWSDARAKADVEANRWPYGWVDAHGYAKPEDRGTVTGRLVLNDPVVESFPGKVMVGLAQPTYSVAARQGQRRNITWQIDAKHYQFWAECDGPDGAFTIPHVSPGNYTLYALADGVLGEFAQADVQVSQGAELDLGELEWTPVRRGEQIWEVGVPNRTATEYAGGDRFFEPDITLQYPKLFPQDVTYTIGSSQPGKDWFFAHVPHNTDPAARVLPYRGVSGTGRETPYAIRFSLDEPPRGQATLRLAICGASTRSINVAINGKPAGEIRLGRNDGVIPRHQVQGLWYEREFAFDASLLQVGANHLMLSAPAGPINHGVVYDYLRLELDADAPVQQAEKRAAPRARNAYHNFPTDWWRETSKKSPSWYRSAPGREMAENILSWQDQNGGWPLMNTTRERKTGESGQAGPWGARGALVKATVNEIRFLVRAFEATRDDRFLTAAARGVEFIVDAQHATGGWPRTVPSRQSDYTHFATFNDDQMVDLMTLLSEVATARQFRVLDSGLRKRSGSAYAKGLDFILKCQIVVNGAPTAWAQQHDEVTFEPRAARAFEPVAITGGESAGVLKFLMEIRRPSPEVARAIEAGVAWYREVQLDGLEYVRVGDDRIVRANPDAPPLWARFYEIGANKPIFAGRDGVIRYDLAEVEKERRQGYAWYNHSGVDLFRRYEEWRHAQAWRELPPTNTDEAAVREVNLPEPLTMVSGEPVTSVQEWETLRRPELLKLFEQHQFGVTPSTPLKPAFEVVERDASGLGGAARRSQARIRFNDDPESPVIRVLRYAPSNATGPVPTLLYIGFSPNALAVDEPGIDEGMAWSAALKARVPDRDAFSFGTFNAKLFVERGYGIAFVYCGDIDPDFDHGGRHGVRSLFGAPGKKRAPDEWGAIGAWSWGLSRVLDYLQTDPAVDGEQVALAGVSRLGKTVLWAAAQDERFAMVVPLLSGEGGAAISRRNYGETVADLTNPSRYHYWYAPRYADYAFDVDALPVDGHLLVSLLAPRPVLQVVGSEDTWSDPMGEWVSAKAAEPVYALYGLSGPKAEQYPQPDTFLRGDIGFYLHDGGHTLVPRDLEIMADFMDQHLKSGARHH